MWTVRMKKAKNRKEIVVFYDVKRFVFLCLYFINVVLLMRLESEVVFKWNFTIEHIFDKPSLCSS